MWTKKFFKSLVSPQALFGWVIILHRQLWKLVEWAGDLDFLSENIIHIRQFLETDWGVATSVLMGLLLVGHAAYRQTPQTSAPAAQEERSKSSVLPKPVVSAASDNVPSSTINKNDEGTGRFYSSADKERISEALFEISEVLNNEGGTLSKRAAAIIVTWNQSRSKPSSEGPPIESLKTWLKEVEQLSNEVYDSIYREISQKHQLYTEIVADVLAPITVPGGKTVESLRDSGRNLAAHLETIAAAHNADPSLMNGLYSLMEPPIMAFRQGLAEFHDWRTAVNQRIGVHKSTTLSGR